MIPANRTAGSVSKGLLLPVLAWFSVSSLLLLWQYHRSHIRDATISFSLLAEGKSPWETPKMTVDGSKFNPGEPVGVGRKLLRIDLRDAEPFVTNVFVWYEGKDLGIINLRRKQARLSVVVEPTINKVEIVGKWASRLFENCGHEDVNLPIGDYEVHTTFRRFKTTNWVRLVRNEQGHVSVKPDFGALHLTAIPANAVFEIRPRGMDEVILKDRTPSIISDLPTGPYTVTVSHGTYRKHTDVFIATTNTNRLHIEFEFAQLSLSSSPPGASITLDGQTIATTPTNLAVEPGRRMIQIWKEDYESTNIALTVTADQTHKIDVVLVGLAYVNAMATAQNCLLASTPDYDMALSSISEARRLNPGDIAAEKFERTINRERRLANARAAGARAHYVAALTFVDEVLKESTTDPEALSLKSDFEKRRREAEESEAQNRMIAASREVRVKELYEQTIKSFRYHTLFDTQALHATGKIDSVRGAILRSFSQKPKWNVERSALPETNISLIVAETKGFGFRNTAVIVSGQTADDTIVTYFKLIELTVDEDVNRTSGGITEEDYVPLHPDWASGGRAQSVERRRSQDLQALRKRIEDEVQKK